MDNLSYFKKKLSQSYNDEILSRQRRKYLENELEKKLENQRINEFYMYMASKYPFLAFTFKGRIKSLIRAEEKFNGYILEYIHLNLNYMYENY